MSNLTNFLAGFALNALMAMLIVRFLYYPANRSKPYVFSLLALNTVLFFVLSLLTSVEIGIGVGFGLFAIFSIMRYRTDTIPIREMTYMFVIAALPVLNTAGAIGKIWPQLLLANLAIAFVLFVLERGWGFRYEATASSDVVFDRLDLLHAERRAELLADLRLRTGITVKRVAVCKIDLPRGTVRLKIYFDTSRDGTALDGMDSVSGDPLADDD